MTLFLKLTYHLAPGSSYFLQSPQTILIFLSPLGWFQALIEWLDHTCFYAAGQILLRSILGGCLEVYHSLNVGSFFFYLKLRLFSNLESPIASMLWSLVCLTSFFTMANTLSSLQCPHSPTQPFPWCHRHVFVTVTKILDRNSLREERFILAFVIRKS